MNAIHWPSAKVAVPQPQFLLTRIPLIYVPLGEPITTGGLSGHHGAAGVQLRRAAAQKCM